MTRAVAAVGVIAAACLAAPIARPAAAAAPTVRVALSADLPGVTVTAGDLVVMDDRGRVLVRPGGRAEIARSRAGIVVNRRRHDVTAVRVAAAKGPMAVDGARVQGALRIKVRSRGLLVVNELEIEQYLRGVVPLEISSKWHPEALKVQAIISRTYAVFQRLSGGHPDYDLVATTMDQVYGGLDSARAASDAAVAATAGRILTYRGEVVFAAFHSTSAGPTEDVREVWSFDFDYLRGVSCPFDAGSPHFRWRKTISAERLERALVANGYSVGTIATVTPYAWTGSGRVGQLRVLHSAGELILRGVELRKLIGYTELPSTNFSIVRFGREIEVEGQGAGHGVGLCQWGAKQMAEMGYRHQEILRYYYPDVDMGHAADFF